MPWNGLVQLMFNTCFCPFYYTNITATNTAGHIKFETKKSRLEAPPTNVAFVGLAVAVTLLPKLKVPFVPFEGG